MTSDKLKEAIPFLKQIPHSIYRQLDKSEFYLPQGKVAKARDELEQNLKSYVMTYKREVLNKNIPTKKHLCFNLKGASLTKNQLRILQKQEKKFSVNSVSFVAYQKPLILVSYKPRIRSKDKQGIWDALLDRASRTVDGLGMHIDKKVLETVTSLWVHSFSTTASCEGHLDWGVKAPWIHIGNQPSNQDLKPIRGKSMLIADIFKKYPKLAQIRDKNLISQRKLLNLLTKFYSNQNTREDTRLILTHFGIYGVTRLTNQGVEIQEINSKHTQKSKLAIYQKEMQDFSKFLKNKYLTL